MNLLQDLRRMLRTGAANAGPDMRREDLLTSLLVMAWMVEARDAASALRSRLRLSALRASS